MFKWLERWLTGARPVRDATLSAVPHRIVDLQRRLPTGPLSAGRHHRQFAFTGSNRADFYRFLRDRIPIVSAGIWTWVHLCATAQSRRYNLEHAHNEAAETILRKLDQRIYPRHDGEASGMARLVEAFFLELFTLGRFALRVQLLPGGRGIRAVELLDPYRLQWHGNRDGRLMPWYEEENGELTKLPEGLFFHRTLVSDLHQPEGVEPLASIPFVVEIEQRMLEDMARSSHNAGTPRLQVAITAPEQLPGENPDSYHERINGYFETTVNQFRTLEADDNIFTWHDVEVEVIGGAGTLSGAWKLNREQVIEDVITGLKLFPWALGRSHGTTKNWIYAQYNLLMQIVDAVQQLGAGLAEWLMRLELRLAGNLAQPRWHFTPNQDPFIVDRNRARLMELERVERLVDGGFISRDQGARELGYDQAFRDQS
ncbi:hypothetical protein GF324_07305 [bacterium]|nr:hypothetical protein [bacterium]